MHKHSPTSLIACANKRCYPQSSGIPQELLRVHCSKKTQSSHSQRSYASPQVCPVRGPPEPLTGTQGHEPMQGARKPGSSGAPWTNGPARACRAPAMLRSLKGPQTLPCPATGSPVGLAPRWGTAPSAPARRLSPATDGGCCLPAGRSVHTRRSPAPPGGGSPQALLRRRLLGKGRVWHGAGCGRGVRVRA